MPFGCVTQHKVLGSQARVTPLACCSLDITHA